MSDIVERLRGQEPLHLGDRLAAADEIDRLRATVERLLRYAYHEEECQVMKWNGGIVCDCGYDELTAALATPSEESKCKTY